MLLICIPDQATVAHSHHNADATTIGYKLPCYLECSQGTSMPFAHAPWQLILLQDDHRYD